MPPKIRRRGEALQHTARGGARTQREAAEVVIGEPQMLDENQQVLHQHILGVGGRVMRGAGLAVRAQVGHEQAEARIGQTGRMSVFHPVDLRRGKQAMDQNKWPPIVRPHRMQGQLVAMIACEKLSRNIHLELFSTSSGAPVPIHEHRKTTRYPFGSWNSGGF
jgi:hypothetical protein